MNWSISWRFVLLCIGMMRTNCLVAQIQNQQPGQDFERAQYILGGLVRMDTTLPRIYLVFTGHEFNDGGTFIRKRLKSKGIPAHFFFTGDYYRNPKHANLIRKLRKDGHYLGAHSDRHLLYVSWENRDSLLINQALFNKDVLDNYAAMKNLGIEKEQAPYFMPPYEWYNQTINTWTEDLGLKLVNFSYGTRSNADYTTPDMGTRYWSSDRIYQSILDHEADDPNGLNGFLLLIHIGTHPSRTDKLYRRLPELINTLQSKRYQFTRLPRLD